jgi:hypothetical protein
MGKRVYAVVMGVLFMGSFPAWASLKEELLEDKPPLQIAVFYQPEFDSDIPCRTVEVKVTIEQKTFENQPYLMTGETKGSLEKKLLGTLIVPAEAQVLVKHKKTYETSSGEGSQEGFCKLTIPVKQKGFTKESFFLKSLLFFEPNGRHAFDRLQKGYAKEVCLYEGFYGV